MVARGVRFFLSVVGGFFLWQGSVFGQAVAVGDACVADPSGLACCEPPPSPCGIHSAADCAWAKPPDPADAVELRLRSLGVRLDGDLSDALGQGGRCLRTPACSPDSGSACSRSLFRSRRAVARFDRIQQFNDDVDPGAFGVLDSPLLAAGRGDGFGVKSGFQVGCPLLWFAPDSNPTDGVDDSFLYLAWDVADVQSLVDAADLVTPVPFDGDGNGSACFGATVTPGDNRDERYEVQLRTCADLRQFDPRNRDADGLLNQFEARFATVINGLAKEPSQTWLHTEVSTPTRALAFRDYGRLHRRIAAFPTSDGLFHVVDGLPTNPSNTCIQTELNVCRREIERTCRLTGQPCGLDSDCRELDFCDGKDECGNVQSCFFNNNNVEMVIKRVETSGLFGPHHGHCRKTGRDCRTDARNSRLCPRVGAHDPLCCDVNDVADVCDEVAADGADAKRNRMALAQLDALFRADTDEDAAAEEEAVIASFTSIPGIEVHKGVRCAGQRVCEGTTSECKTSAECELGRTCVEAPFTQETPRVAPGAVLEFEVTISNTGNEDLDVAVRDVLDEVDMDPQLAGTQTLSGCEVICEDTCSISGVACDVAHPCSAGESCVAPIRAFLTSPRRALANYEVTAKNAERPPICMADRSQCLRAPFLSPTCTGDAGAGGFLDAIRLGSTSRVGTLLGARSARTGEACSITDGDSIRVRMRVRTSLAIGVTPDAFCLSTPLTSECRNRVSVDGRIVEPVLVRTGVALGPCTSDWDCDDGLVCNGVEVCGASGQCQTSTAGTEFCPRASVCNALEDPCRFPRPGEIVASLPAASTLGQLCTSEVQCDDGRLCNGMERCRIGVCVAGPLACGVGLACDERNALGERIDPCGRIAASDGVNEADSSIEIDFLCRNVQLVKEVGFPQCPCSFTTGVSALSLSGRCQGIDPSSTNCCCAHDAPGCQDIACRDSVCVEAPSCCDGAWSAECVRLARDRCATCGSTLASVDVVPGRGVDPSSAGMAYTAASGPLGVDSLVTAAGAPFVPLTVRYRLTATNRGVVTETVTLRDDKLCRDLNAASTTKPGELLVASDCAICLPPALSPTAFGPMSLSPGATATTTCTVTFRSEAALAAFLRQDKGTCVGGDRSGSTCAVSDDCPGGHCLFSSCEGEAPIRGADGEDCYRNCANVTAAGDDPWLRPAPLLDSSTATICLRPCELNVCKQVRCLDDCDPNRPGPWHSERACSQHPELCCETSPDCPDFDPQNPSGMQSEQCIDQPRLIAAPGSCLQYRITATNPPSADAALCAMEFTDQIEIDGGPDSNPFQRVPYDVMVLGRRCESDLFPPDFGVMGIPKICKFLPIVPGGVAALQPGESVAVQFRADLKPAPMISAASTPRNRVSVRAQRSDDGCDGDPAEWELPCSGDGNVSVDVRVCELDLTTDVTCEDPRDGIALRLGVAYSMGQPPDILPSTRVWFRVDLENSGGFPIQTFHVEEMLRNSVGDGCNPSWFVPGSVIASIGNEDVTPRICTVPRGNCDDFGDLSGVKDFTTRPIIPGERLVITFAVDQPDADAPFSHRGTEFPDYDCRNSITVTLITASMNGGCENGNVCPNRRDALADFNIEVPRVECAKEACLDNNYDGDCLDLGDGPFSTSLYLSPGLSPPQPDSPFPITVVYRMTAENSLLTLDGTAETELSAVEICDPRLAGAIRAGSLNCVGGAQSGKLCRNDADCSGTGSRCGDLHCRGGSNHGAVCVQDVQCPAGVCGTAVCAGGAQAGMGCRVDGDCPGGTCRAPVEAVGCALVVSGSVNDCVLVGLLGSDGASDPASHMSRTCGVRFNRLAAWEQFSANDRVGGGCDRACFSNEAIVRATAATGVCEGGNSAGKPCSTAEDCAGGMCRVDVCGATNVVSSECMTNVCIEPACAIDVVKEARCLPDCASKALGEDEGWVRDPDRLWAIPGACVEYRVKICNTSKSGIRLCRLEFSDEMLVDGLRDSSDFVGSPMDVRLVGRQCQGIDFAQAFNWGGQAITCTLVDALTPDLPLPIEPGDCVIVGFVGQLKGADSSGAPNIDHVPTNRFSVRGDGTCADDCANDRSAGFSCEDADHVALHLQTCDFTVVHDEGCPESGVGFAVSRESVWNSQRGEGPTPTPDDCEDIGPIAGIGSAVELLPGSAPELHLRLENKGRAPIDRLAIGCGSLNTCEPSWYVGALVGTICGPEPDVCLPAALCTCSGQQCEVAYGLCTPTTFLVCGGPTDHLVRTEIHAGQQLDLVVAMSVPEGAPLTVNPVDCVTQFSVQAGTTGCAPEEGCGTHCTTVEPVNVLLPRLDCEKGICADLDRNGACDEDYKAIVDLGPNPPVPFDLKYRVRLLNTGEVDLKNVKVSDPQLWSSGAPYVVVEHCDFAVGGGSTEPISLAKGAPPREFFCTLRFFTLADFESFADADGRPNNAGEICYTNTAEPSAEVDPPLDACFVDAPVRIGSCSADVCTRKCSDDNDEDDQCTPTTTVVIEVFNENESKFSGIARCVDSWDDRLLSSYVGVGVPNYFWRESLGTDKGMARIDGVASAACGKESTAAPLLGVASKMVLFTDDRTRRNVERTGLVPVGLGAQVGTIWYDIRAGGGDGVVVASADAVGGQVTATVDLGNDTPVGGIARLGSLLVFPKIEIKWNARNELIQDTFLDIANNTNRAVYIQAYLVESEQCGISGHGFGLTMNQPVFWSAARGDPRFVAPFTSLGEGCRDEDPRNPGGRVLRGYLLLWAVDPTTLREIRWNSLKGDALVLNYAEGSAWEYEAWAFQALAGVGAGSLLREPFGQLDLDGIEYEAAPDELLLDFYAVGARLGGVNTSRRAEIDTDLALWAVLKDLRGRAEARP